MRARAGAVRKPAIIAPVSGSAGGEPQKLALKAFTGIEVVEPLSASPLRDGIYTISPSRRQDLEYDMDEPL